MKPYGVGDEARRLGGLPTFAARRELGNRVAHTFLLTGEEFARGLDFNAHLVTELRERKVLIWGDG